MSRWFFACALLLRLVGPEKAIADNWEDRLRALEEGAAPLWSPGETQLAQADSASFDIPRQALIPALIQFTDVTGIQLFFSSEMARGLDSPGVSGSMSPEEALRALLTGTGLAYRFTDSNTVTLEKAASGDGAVELDPVRVDATRLGATTEGTGSYTSDAVTIGKGEHAPREIPQSVSVITRQRMDDQNLDTLQDVLENATGITSYQSGTGGKYYYSRGFPIDTFQYDGVPLQRGFYTASSSFIAGTAIFDRVEILRGAAGLLQGAGDPGGTVNLVRKRGQTEATFAGTARAGSWDTYGVLLDGGGPLNADGNLRGRLVFDYDDKESFVDVVESDRKTFYGALDFEIAPDTVIGVGVSYEDQDAVPFFNGLPRYSDGEDLELSRSTFLGADWNRWDNEQLTVYADLEHSFSENWKAKLSAIYVDESNEMKYAQAAGAIDPVTLTGAFQDAYYLDYNNEHYGVDAYVAGKIDAFGRQHELILGASATRLKTDDYGVGGALSAIDVFDPDPDVPEPSNDELASAFYYAQTSQSDIEQEGVYGTLRIKILDPLTLIAGGRVSWYDYSFAVQDHVWGAVSEETVKEGAVFTPFAGIVYDLNDNWSVYASYAEIFKPQTYVTSSGQPLDPVVGVNYEAGVKAEFYDGRLNGSLAFFRIDQTNLPQQDLSTYPCPAAGGNYCYTAAGKVRSQGIDVEVSGEILPNLQLFAGYTFNHTEYLKDASNEGQPLNTYTPEHIFRLWADYAFAGSLEGLSVGGGVNFQSSNYRQIAPDLKIVQDAYDVWSARVGYRLNEHFSAAVNVNNIFDERYYSSIGTTGWANYYGEPRNVLLTVRAEW